MGFPINLPSGKGMTINYMLCKYSFGLFFSGASAARWWRSRCNRDKSPCLMSFLQPPAPLGRGCCKKCDRKKQQQGGCAEAGIKTVQVPLRQAQRPLG